MWKAVLIAGIWLGCVSIGEAQVFRRTRWSNSPPARKSDTVSQNGHWGFPGRIQDHLTGFHRQDVSGLSYEQMLDLHDAIHEGRPIPRKPQKQTPPPIVESVQPARVERPKQSLAPSV